MCSADSENPFTSLRRVRYSLNEAAQSWREIRACFEQEWKQEKSYRVQAMLMPVSYTHLTLPTTSRV